MSANVIVYFRRSLLYITPASSSILHCQCPRFATYRWRQRNCEVYTQTTRLSSFQKWILRNVKMN